MRVTIEPCEEQLSKRDVNLMHSTITVSHPSDDLDVYGAMELCCKVLIGYGYDQQSVAETLDPEFAEYNLGITPTKYDFEGLDLPEEAEKYVPPFEGENPYHYVGTPPGETGLPGESVCSTEDKYPDAVAKSTYSQSNIPREITQEEAEKFEREHQAKLEEAGDSLGDEHLADYTSEDTDEKI